MTTPGTASELDALVAAELTRDPGPEATAMAAHLATRPGVAAVLFYGARLRGAADARSGGGPLDFYVLTDSDAAYHGPGLAALANRLLPPNVYHEVIEGRQLSDAPDPGPGPRSAGAPLANAPACESGPRTTGAPLANAPASEPGPRTTGARPGEVPGQARDVPGGASRIEAKVAVATMTTFRARMRPEALDTTFWARFTQPVTLVWARSAADRQAAAEAVAAAVRTAAWWAVRLAPEGAGPVEMWETLFRHTYGSELRVEGGGRVGGIVAAAPERYRRLADLLIAPVTPAERAAAARGWRWRRRLGKLRNLARLAKAAFTYRGGVAYALSKVERHSGRPVELSPWQRRLPWLAAPMVLWRLWREGRLR